MITLFVSHRGRVYMSYALSFHVAAALTAEILSEPGWSVHIEVR